MNRILKFLTALTASAALVVAPAAPGLHHLIPAAHATGGNYTQTTEFRTQLLSGTFGNLTSANAVTFKLLSSSSNISTSSTVCSSVTGELSTANGYTSGGQTGTLVATGTTSVTMAPSANIVWTASGGSIVARFLLACAGTTPHVVAYGLLDVTPADVTASSGNSLTISNSASLVSIA